MLKGNSLAERWTVYAIALTLGAVAWQLVSYKTSPTFLSSFTATMAQLWDFILDGTLEAALLSSLGLFVSGMFFAIIVGLLLGLFLIPFILSTMGFGFAPKTLVVFLVAFVPILYNTVEGARSLKPELLEVARSYRSSEYEVWRDVLIPYTLPFALTGIRQAVARGLVGMISAELFLSSSGMGQLIMKSGQDFDIPALYGSILVVTILGVILMSVGRALENHFAAWRGLER